MRLFQIIQTTHLVVAATLTLLATGCGDTTGRSTAMAPTIKPGERVTINYAAYGIDAPERWDVIAFHPPFSPSSTFLFRVVGLPGETISSDETGVRLNNQPIKLPDHLTNITYLSIERSLHSDAHTDIKFPYLIPKDHYFVLGDNSSNANDSRFWGAVPRSNILGRVKGK